MSGTKQIRFGRIAMRGLVLLGVAALLMVVARARTTPTTMTQAERIARGEYLVTVGGCNDCHTPWVMGPDGPAPDMTRTLTGHPHDVPLTPAAPLVPGWGMVAAESNTAFSGPWGVSFAANLTPCERTGTGVWTEETFINTLRRGRHWGQSRPLLPPMPWFNYGKMTDDDLKSIFAYLQSLPAHYNPVPQPLPPGGPVVSTDFWEQPDPYDLPQAAVRPGGTS